MIPMPKHFIIIILDLQFTISTNQFPNPFAEVDFLNHPTPLLKHDSPLSDYHFHFKVIHLVITNC